MKEKRLEVSQLPMRRRKHDSEWQETMRKSPARLRKSNLLRKAGFTYDGRPILELQKYLISRKFSELTAAETLECQKLMLRLPK